MTSSYDWTKFQRQIYIKAAPEQVFQMWTTADNIIQWFIAEATYTNEAGQQRVGSAQIQAGDRYVWEWHQPNRIDGTILEVVDNERVKFTFGNKENAPEEQHIVTVEVSEVDGETLLTLTQENMADLLHSHHSWHLSCNLGWSFFMTNLKACLEHGIDLRETDAAKADAARAISTV